MVATEPHARFCTQTTHPADRTILVLINPFLQKVRISYQISTLFCFFSHFGNTFGVKTGQALSFTVEATTWMTTSERFRTICLDHILALFPQANICHRILLTSFHLFHVLVCQFISAKSTLSTLLFVLELLTSHACVIGHLLALLAMILVALLTSYAVLSHMDGSFGIYRLPLIIFGLEVNLARFDLHDRPTRTCCQILVIFHVAL